MVEPTSDTESSSSLPPEQDGTPDLRLAPDLKIGEVRRGQKPGTRYVRVTRAAERPFLRTGATRWRATLAAERPRTGRGRLLASARRFIFGAPLASSMAGEERLSKLMALPIFSSDALSSSAYATEEILLALVLAGTGALTLGLPVSIAIAVLLVVVVASYRETIKAYPRGGGTYSVASENLGKWPGLVAAASLLTDYVLTVAVSISAGALAIISAVPSLAPYRVEMAVVAVILMAAGNLRGLREAGTIFAIPTYLFMLGFGGMLITGLVRLAFGFEGASLATSASPHEQVEAVQSLTLFLILRAFASGATALTGVEAIANGVQAFKPPESKNASATLVIMAAILAAFFIGATFLGVRFGIVPNEEESVISQIGRAAFGGENFFYYYLQGTTALILVLAANTAFNGFPMLGSILARDEYLPRQFAFRGDRLAYSNGIIVLTSVALGLLVLFQADTHRLIPLYAIGVFLAFTLSQYGMVLRWRRLREPGWMLSASINGLGAALTAVALVVVAATKFSHGAWVVLILIPVLVATLYVINRHYASARTQLQLAQGPMRLGLTLTSDRPVVVPVSEINVATARALHYARGISTNVTALHVVTEEGEDTTAIEEAWQERYPDTPLIILESPYRSFQAPFMAYIDALTVPQDVPLTIVLPEFVPAHWWQRFLHNRTANRLRDALFRRPNTVVVSVTQQLA
jgi:amino acid transporter